MHTVTLSDKTLLQLRQAAALRGVETDAYAEELLEISLAVLNGRMVTPAGGSHHAMEFSGIAPTGRAAAEIDAEIEASRADWDGNFPAPVAGKALPSSPMTKN